MSRFKTELCNNLIELGSCKYGDRCHYAHGLHELRQVVKRHPKFRTEKCKNFELTGKCPFGPRCSYVHSKPDLDSMIEQLTRYVKHKRAPRPDSDDEQDENGTRRLRIKYTTPSSESTPTMDGGLTELESRDAYTNGAHSRISSFNNDENKENIEDIAAINSSKIGWQHQPPSMLRLSMRNIYTTNTISYTPYNSQA